MLTSDTFSDIASELPTIDAGHPVIAAHENLHTAFISFQADGAQDGIEELGATAAQGLEAIAQDSGLWNALEAVHAAWDAGDTEFVQQLLQCQSNDVFEAEQSILESAGVSASASVPLLTAIATPVTDAGVLSPEVARRQTIVLQEQIKQQEMIDDYEDRKHDKRFRRRLRHIFRAIHVVGGGALVLADIGSTIGLAIANPLTLVGTTSVATVSLKVGSDLMRTGLEDDPGQVARAGEATGPPDARAAEQAERDRTAKKLQRVKELASKSPRPKPR